MKTQDTLTNIDYYIGIMKNDMDSKAHWDVQADLLRIVCAEIELRA